MSAIKLSAPTTREFWELPILFEDAQLLVVIKPAGLLVSPDPQDAARPNLVGLAKEAIAAAKPWAQERHLTHLVNAHRLDADQSGVLVLAKDKATLIALANLFGSETPQLTYFTVVTGHPTAAHFEVNAKLAPNPVKLELMRVDSQQGKKSLTHFEVVEQFARHAAVRCRPTTHRPHQIRVHLRHAGFPVAGDALYGGKPLLLSRLKPDFRLKPGREERPLLAQPLVHLEEMRLPHPSSGQTLHFTAPQPKELRVALRYLREFSSGGAPAAAPT